MINEWAKPMHIINWYQLFPDGDIARRQYVNYAGYIRVAPVIDNKIGKAITNAATNDKQATHIGLLEWDIAMDGDDFAAMKETSKLFPFDIICGQYVIYPNRVMINGWGCVVIPKSLITKNAESWNTIDYTRNKDGAIITDGPAWCWRTIRQPLVAHHAHPKHLHWLT
jgi:hypothetical protein